jgi:hypothetical protein
VIPWVPKASQQIPGKVDAAAKKKTTLAIDAKATLAGKAVTADIRLKRLDPELKLPESVGVVPVLWQKKAVTRCTAGENKGKTLAEFFLVLEAQRPLSVKKALEEGVSARFEAPKGVKAEDLGVAVLVEDTTKMRTVECTSVPVQAASTRKGGQ